MFHFNKASFFISFICFSCKSIHPGVEETSVFRSLGSGKLKETNNKAVHFSSQFLPGCRSRKLTRVENSYSLQQTEPEHKIQLSKTSTRLLLEQAKPKLYVDGFMVKLLWFSAFLPAMHHQEIVDPQFNSFFLSYFLSVFVLIHFGD